MQKFTATDARNLSSQLFDAEYDETISKIQEQAKKGNFILYIYNSSLSLNTIRALEKNGFEVKNSSSIEVQRDSIYHVICW